ncbi:hypothetical protein D3C78_1500590 [compost metagenome]
MEQAIYEAKLVACNNMKLSPSTILSGCVTEGKGFRPVRTAVRRLSLTNYDIRPIGRLTIYCRCLSEYSCMICLYHSERMPKR